jgi:membrane protease YdiL (CAAX protease family)
VSIPAAFKDIIIALVLFLLSGVAAAWISGSVPGGLRLSAVVVSQGGMLVAVVGVMLARRGGRWRDIGLVAPVPGDLWRGVLAFGGCLVINLLFVQLLWSVAPDAVETHTEELGVIARQLSHGLPFPALVAVVVFVGVYEELFARGLLLSLCRTLLGGTWAPVVVSSLLFGLGHLYQGWIGVVQTTLIGLVLALAVIRWRTLWPAIVAHALLDIFAMLVMTGSQGSASL